MAGAGIEEVVDAIEMVARAAPDVSVPRLQMGFGVVLSEDLEMSADDQREYIGYFASGPFAEITVVETQERLQVGFELTRERASLERHALEAWYGKPKLASIDPDAPPGGVGLERYDLDWGHLQVIFELKSQKVRSLNLVLARAEAR